MIEMNNTLEFSDIYGITKSKFFNGGYMMFNSDCDIKFYDLIDFCFDGVDEDRLKEVIKSTKRIINDEGSIFSSDCHRMRFFKELNSRRYVGARELSIIYLLTAGDTLYDYCTKCKKNKSLCDKKEFHYKIDLNEYPAYIFSKDIKDFGNRLSIVDLVDSDLVDKYIASTIIISFVILIIGYEAIMIGENLRDGE
ncbi:MAG: hypothetical protein MJ236_04130 [Clostridia bacterium]|nr:hypothetical protein [Clostridia bacterium]